MRSLLAAVFVVAAVSVPAAQAAPADCADLLTGPHYRVPQFVTRDDQGRIIVNPSAADPHVQHVVTVLLCLT